MWQCKRHTLVAKLVTDANGITCWPKLESMLVAPLGGKTSGTTYNWPNLEPMQVAFFLAGEITQVKESVVPLAMFFNFLENMLQTVKS